MTPKTVFKDVEIIEQPSLTYALNIEKNIIGGFVDKQESVKQAVYLILNTERFKYPIYSWNYGVEFMDLFGQPANLCISEIKRKISEALLQDDRIISVDNFNFTADKSAITAVFTVNSVFGNFESEVNVNV
jgi:hypothetical protein